MNPFLDSPTPSASFIVLLLNHPGLLAWTMWLNDDSLLDEGQEAGPVFIAPESFVKLPTLCIQSERSHTDGRPSRDNRSAHVDCTSRLGIYFYLSQP